MNNREHESETYIEQLKCYLVDFWLEFSYTKSDLIFIVQMTNK